MKEKEFTEKEKKLKQIQNTDRNNNFRFHLATDYYKYKNYNTALYHIEELLNNNYSKKHKIFYLKSSILIEMNKLQAAEKACVIYATLRPHTEDYDNWKIFFLSAKIAKKRFDMYDYVEFMIKVLSCKISRNDEENVIKELNYLENSQPKIYSKYENRINELLENNKPFHNEIFNLHEEKISIVVKKEEKAIQKNEVKNEIDELKEYRSLINNYSVDYEETIEKIISNNLVDKNEIFVMILAISYLKTGRRKSAEVLMKPYLKKKSSDTKINKFVNEYNIQKRLVRK